MSNKTNEEEIDNNYMSPRYLARVWKNHITNNFAAYFISP